MSMVEDLMKEIQDLKDTNEELKNKLEDVSSVSVPSMLMILLDTH
jgi:cell division septum initiation protein DivIVA